MGDEFSIEEHEIALRWVDRMRPEYCRVVVCLDFKDADELLLVCWRNQVNPAFVITRQKTSVLVIDGLGMTRLFPTLVDALLAMSPELKANRRDLIRGRRAECIAADAVGGGKLAGQILSAMESHCLDQVVEYDRYGSKAHKRVNIYGGLDIRPSELDLSYGMSWGVDGWLIFDELKRMKAGRLDALRSRRCKRRLRASSPVSFP